MDKDRFFVRFASLVFAVAVAACALVARAADVGTEPVILVAKPALNADQLYGSTILIVKPVGDDQHLGFIINKPTPLTLGRLFPEHEPSQKVTDPVYLGGPISTSVLFALVKRHDSPGARAMEIAPDLYAVVDRVGVDNVIEKESDHARFYAGLVIWQPGELRDEIDRGFWYVLDADTKLVLRKSTEGMWEELLERSRIAARRVRASAEDAQPYAYLF